ncbi:DUF4291 domain-containing protein [Actinoplanes bogorensis]|uniref:DUF4291 domain-containing protein n=1 Tax=Paractinoplanes bogorensis TaxID=1610840 RepID=A0ABS5YMA8_9ACTN|nr:DUF4291 domain-containing protein [Actinoplanes bogorensis]MBU2664587.1 DUF4291 domain-containing protein [Actinoplanes bogorensis]
MQDVPYHQIRATYDDSTVTVYQAYSPAIALPALAAGRFVPPFKRGRMTWVKPSFRWMMYRCGWATKPGQEHVLAITIRRDGFEWALSRAVLSHYSRDVHESRAAWQKESKASPVRVQWDPERDLHLRPLPHRSLQLGLSGEAADRYADEWTTSITDVTELARTIHTHVKAGDLATAASLLPPETPYPAIEYRGR